MPENAIPLILAFDTAGAALSVALCHGRRALAAMHLPMQRGHVELLLPAIEAVMKAAGRTFADLDAIATTVGPGSFTGLRTGLAAAQGLAFATDAPLVGIDRFTALATTVRQSREKQSPAGPLVVAFDSKARSLYVQAFAADGSRLEGWPAEGRNLTVEETLSALGSSGALLAGDGAPLLLDAGMRAEDTGIRVLTAPMVAAEAAAELATGHTGWPPHPLYLAPPRAKLPKDGGRLRARRG